MIRQFSFVLIIANCAKSSDYVPHPYAFEKPGTSESLSQQRAFEDSQLYLSSEFSENHRNSLGENEIRKRILLDVTNSSQFDESTKMSSPHQLDLKASESKPEAQPLRSLRENHKVKNHQTEYSKTKHIKPSVNYFEDYYYYYDDDFYPDTVTKKPWLKLSQKKKLYSNKKLPYSGFEDSDRVTPVTSPPLYSPVTQPFFRTRQGLGDELETPPRLPHIKKKFGSTDRADTGLDESGASNRLKYRDEYYDDYYYYDDFEVVENKDRRRSDGYSSSGGGINPLALLIAPLVGISLLTAAVAVALNPVLVSVSVSGRKRRSIDDDPTLRQMVDELQVLENFLGKIPENLHYQQTILSMYLTCSGYTDPSNRCLDRIVCEYSNPESNISSEERDVLSIVLYNIMSNKLLTEDFKDRLKTSARYGRDEKLCSQQYNCADLDLKLVQH